LPAVGVRRGQAAVWPGTQEESAAMAAVSRAIMASSSVGTTRMRLGEASAARSRGPWALAWFLARSRA